MSRNLPVPGAAGTVQIHRVRDNTILETAFLLYRSWARRMMLDGAYVFDATIWRGEGPGPRFGDVEAVRSS
jgi:hypothetical protein